MTEVAPLTDALVGAIRNRLPELRLLTDAVDRESYRRDETAYLQTGLPCAVALPTETRQVAELVRLCGEFGVPIVPRGAGTGLSGGAAGIEGALTIAFTAMDKVLEIDGDNLVVVTQPGIINAALKKAVAAEGLFYAPDPASFEICSIGGNLGTNAGGLCCIKYGQTRESVLGLEVVMADGTVLRTGGKNVKDVAGYSLTHLIVGSQGTLAMVTEAILRLRPLPPPRSTLIAFFATLEAAGEAVAGIARAGLSPVTLELMDQLHDRGGRRHAGSRAGSRGRCDAHGRVRPPRCTAAGIEMDAARVVCEAAGATQVVQATDPQEADWLRQGRRAAFHALERLGTARMEDVGVPRARVPEMLVAIEGVAAKHEVRDRDVRSRGRRQPPPHVRLRARRPERRGHQRGRARRPVQGRDRARWHDHRRARRRRCAARLPRAPAWRGGDGR